jgi:hypothetical protein
MGKSASDQLKSLWKSWVRVAQWIGNFQARVLLTILYAVVLLPFGICLRLFADPLRTKEPPAKWLSRSRQTINMSWAHKQ